MSAAALGVREVGDAERPVRDDELDGLFAPLEDYDVVVLAVSGGADSTAMMHLVARWHGRRTKPTPRVAVATIDHALRPESPAEAAAVGVAAAALGLSHHVRRWDGPKPATGLQAAARDVRYRLLDDVLRGLLATAPRRDLKHGPRGCVVTAHTADDQAETFIMRLARGSGADGLSAMAPTVVRVIDPDTRAHSDPTESEQRSKSLLGRIFFDEPGSHFVGKCSGRVKTLDLVRPLLGVSRARLVATLKAAGVSYVDDPSNADMRFERVRIRQALETLEAVGVSREAIARSAGRLRHVRVVVERTSAALLSNATAHPFGLYMVLNENGFRAADHETGLRAFRLALAQMGGVHPPSSLATIESAFTQLFRNPVSKTLPPRLTLHGCIVESSSGSATTERVVHIFREEHRNGGLETARLLPGEELYWDRRFFVRAKPGWRSSVTVGPLGDDWANLTEKVPELKDLLPAKAARTMPCVRTADGRFACPGLMDAATRLRQAKVELNKTLAPDAPEVLERAARGTLFDPAGPSADLHPADVSIVPAWGWAPLDPDQPIEF